MKGYPPENHHAHQQLINVKPAPPKVKPFAFKSDMSSSLLDEKRAMGTAATALATIRATHDNGCRARAACRGANSGVRKGSIASKA